MGAMPDLWGRLLTAALGAVLPLLVGALVGVPAWVRSRWEAKRRQDELVGEMQSLGGTVEYLRQELADARAEGARQRSAQDAEIAKVREAQHVQMRHELIHDAEKMIANGCATAAERESWWESYRAYDALGANGYIADYWERLRDLPTREV